MPIRQGGICAIRDSSFHPRHLRPDQNGFAVIIYPVYAKHVLCEINSYLIMLMASPSAVLMGFGKPIMALVASRCFRRKLGTGNSLSFVGELTCYAR